MKVMERNSLSNKALFVLLIVLFSKIIGLIRDILMAYKFGTTNISDAYTVTLLIPSVFYAIFMSGTMYAYVPFYSRIVSKQEKSTFFSNILIIYTCLSLFGFCICFLLRNVIAHYLAPGFSADTLAFTSQFIGIISFSLVPQVLFSIFIVQLQCEEIFSFPKFCNFILVNIILVLFIIYANGQTGKGLVEGYVISQITPLVVIFPYFIKKSKIQFSPDINYEKRKYIDFLRMSLIYGFVALSNRLNTASDSFFASMLGIGVTSGLNYANKIQALFLSLTTSVFMFICIPRVSNYFAQKNYESGLYYIRNSIDLITFLSLPLAALLFVFCRPLVVLFFKRGIFDENSTKITVSCLAYYSLGIPFYSYVEIQIRTLTADLKQMIILKNTVISVLLNILLDYFLMRIMGCAGLALATSLSGIILFILNSYDLKKANLSIIDKKNIIDIVKSLLASFISIMLSRFLYVIFWKSLGATIAFSISMILFISSYMVQCWIYKINVLLFIIQRIKNNV